MKLPDDGHRHELDEGRLITTPLSSWRSSALSLHIAINLGGHIDAHKLGMYVGANAGVILQRNPDTVRAPDFTFVSHKRWRDPGWGYFEGAPDLVVEVLSFNDSFTRMTRKVMQYLAAGVRLVWLVDPERRIVEVYRADGSTATLAADGILDGEDVLPGYTLPLTEMWV